MGIALTLALAASTTACGPAPGGSSTASTEQVARGRAEFQALGCVACHVVESGSAERKVGPPLVGVYGRQVTLTDGRILRVDKAYLRESITQPDAATVAGYQRGVMAAGLGPARARLDDPTTVDALVAYLSALR